MHDLPGILGGFPSGDAWATNWIEDSYSALGHASDLTFCQSESFSWVIVLSPPLGFTVQAITVFATSLPIEQDFHVRLGSAYHVIPPAGGVANVAVALVTELRTLELVSVTEGTNFADAGSHLSPVLLEPVSVLSVPPLSYPRVRSDVTSARPLTVQRTFFFCGVRTKSMRKQEEQLGSEPTSVPDDAHVREEVISRPRCLRRYVLLVSLPVSIPLVVAAGWHCIRLLLSRGIREVVGVSPRAGRRFQTWLSHESLG